MAERHGTRLERAATTALKKTLEVVPALPIASSTN
jgi:hypothetical protein